MFARDNFDGYEFMPTPSSDFSLKVQKYVKIAAVVSSLNLNNNSKGTNLYINCTKIYVIHIRFVQNMPLVHTM